MATETFSRKVLDIVSKIPKGETRTYKQVAIEAGSPHACRAVGTILSKNYDSKIPCHRVVESDGSFGQYNRGIELKREKLLEEGTI